MTCSIMPQLCARVVPTEILATWPRCKSNKTVIKPTWMMVECYCGTLRARNAATNQTQHHFVELPYSEACAAVWFRRQSRSYTFPVLIWVSTLLIGQLHTWCNRKVRCKCPFSAVPGPHMGSQTITTRSHGGALTAHSWERFRPCLHGQGMQGLSMGLLGP